MSQKQSPSHPQDSRAIIARLWHQWVAPYRARIIAALGLMVVVAATSSAYPALISQVFNRLQE